MIRASVRVARNGAYVLLGLFVVFQLWMLAHVLWWVDHNPSSSSFMQAGLARLQATDPNAELRHKWAPYDKISIHLKQAIVAAEDSRFLDHEGFDWEGIQNAVEKNLKKGRVVAGGSTISQQLAKNLFLSGQRSFLRKGEEAIITLMIENVMSKRRILEIYLNIIEWGDGIYGAEAASRHYFRTAAANLNAGQAAALAAMVPNPRWFEDHRASRKYQHRVAVIAARMRYAQVPR
ncbi:MAG: monofunctional biosynthetic peptidoglycan transglycosylase [Thiobacillaceae bacterium]|jgi:monofunctional biosynthetic peptidoglycan transglycosylase